MSDKVEKLQRIKETGIIGVVRTENSEKALKTVEALKNGGLEAIEITMTVPGALDVIKELTDTYSEDEILLGAGSVMDAETARSCILAGAEYIVGPTLDKKMIELCNRYQKPVVPGAMSVTEVKKAMEAGADLVKVFPASLFGPKIIKSIKAPIPQAPLLPTGGVNLDNVDQWIKAGSFGVGVGSGLTAGAGENDYDKIEDNAREFIAKIEQARAEIN